MSHLNYKNMIQIATMGMASMSLLSSAQTASKPNIIYILADDLGYNEIGCYGQQKIKTPNIDKIATEGIKFTNHYAGQTVCAPSRCAFLTGKHMGHAQIRDNKEPRAFTPTEPVGAVLAGEGQEPLKANTVTFPKILQENGYHTACMGKWGLGMHVDEGSPHNQGFDFFYGNLCQGHAHNYYPSHLWKTNTTSGDIEQEILYAPGNGNDNVSKHGEHYATDLISAEALTYIDERCQPENKSDPFFLYMAYPTPHVSLQVPGSDGTKEVTDPDPFEYGFSYYNALGWNDPAYIGTVGPGQYTGHYKPRAAYAAMISRMDRDIGRIMEKLKDNGIDDNTLVIFTSDNGATFNGGSDSTFFNSVGELRGLKCALYEGGIRIPMVARWPGHIATNTSTDHISAFWDMMPTFCDLAGATTPSDIDGLSLLPTLTGEGAQSQHATLYWEYSSSNGRQALRQGNWKAVRYNVNTDPYSTVELYNLSTDIGEQINVASQNPEKAVELSALMRSSRTPSYIASWNSFDTRINVTYPGTSEGFNTTDNAELTAVTSPSNGFTLAHTTDKASAIKKLATPITESTEFSFDIQWLTSEGANKNGYLLLGQGPENISSGFDEKNYISAGFAFGRSLISSMTGYMDSNELTVAMPGGPNDIYTVSVKVDFINRVYTIETGGNSVENNLPDNITSINYVGYGVNGSKAYFTEVSSQPYTPAEPEPSQVWNKNNLNGCLFNGASKITFDSYKGITGNSARTFEAWIKAKTTGLGVLTSWGTNSSSNKFVFLVNADGNLRCETSGDFIIGTTNIHDNKWHHVAVIIDPTATPNVRFVIDGLTDTASSFGAASGESLNINTTASANLSIGADTVSTNASFNGVMDEVRLWNKALTNEQLSAVDISVSKGAKSELVNTTTATPVTGLSWSDLEFYLPFNGEGEDQTIDSSDNNHSSTLTAVTKLQNSIQPGKALQFNNGASQAVNLGSLTGIQNQDSITFESWVKLDSRDTFKRLFYMGPSATNRFAIIFENSTLVDDVQKQRIQFELGGGERYTTPYVFVENEWFHLAIVVDGTNDTVTYYKDGVELLNRSYTAKSATSGDAYISYPDSSGLNGSVDELRLWNVPRTSSQIISNMNKPLTGSETGLVSYYRFDQGAENSIRDYARNSDGTLQKMDQSAWIDSSALINNMNHFEAFITAGSTISDSKSGLELTPGAGFNASSTAVVTISSPKSGLIAPITTITNSLDKEITLHLKRTWKISSYSPTRATNEISLTFDNSASLPGTADKLNILYKAAPEDTFEVLETVVPIIKSNSITFAPLALSDGYYTLGTIEILTPAFGIDLSSELVESGIKLSWSVEVEIGIAYYLLEKNIDGEWIEVEKVMANESNEYFIIDKAGTKDKEYRLSVFDINGLSQTYSVNNQLTLFYNLKEGWNLFSLPAKSLNNLSDFFGKQIWTWHDSSYVLAETVEPLQGFWLYSLKSETVQIPVEPINSYIINCSSGWNLVGPAEDGLLPEEIEVAYSWDNNYDQLLNNQSMMFKKQGYWLFSLVKQKLTIHTTKK